MKLVRAALGDRVEDRAAVAAVLGAELVRDQPYFLNQVRVVELDHAAADAEVVVVLAVEQEVIRAQSSAIRRVVDTVGESSLVRLKLADTGRRERDVVDVAIRGNRQLRQPAAVKTRADF